MNHHGVFVRTSGFSAVPWVAMPRLLFRYQPVDRLQRGQKTRMQQGKNRPAARQPSGLSEHQHSLKVLIFCINYVAAIEPRMSETGKLVLSV